MLSSLGFTWKHELIPKCYVFCVSLNMEGQIRWEGKLRMNVEREVY
jgi:hypothetical protein